MVILKTESDLLFLVFPYNNTRAEQIILEEMLAHYMSYHITFICKTLFMSIFCNSVLTVILIEANVKISNELFAEL